MDPEQSRRHWLELDLLRAIAAAMMVANHVAVKRATSLEDRSHDAIEIASFVGSFAPVLFFFLTGLGHGVQSARRHPGRGYQYLAKAGILFAADAMLWINPNRMSGMDFLGFIAVSMVLLRWVQYLPWNGVLAILIGSAFVLLRFVVGPAIRPVLPESGWGQALAFAIGVSSLPRFSYPPAPWMAYPFLGYGLGQIVGRHGTWIEKHRPAATALMATIGGLGTGATMAFVARGAVLFRWGTMSLAYFAASLAVLAICLTVVVALGGMRKAAPLLDLCSLSGIRSFAVVPLHYLLLGISLQAVGPISDTASYSVRTLTVLVLSFAGSSAIPRLAGWLKTSFKDHAALMRAAIVAGALCALVTLATGSTAGMGTLTVRTTSSLALCVLLGLL